MTSEVEDTLSKAATPEIAARVSPVIAAMNEAVSADIARECEQMEDEAFMRRLFGNDLLQIQGGAWFDSASGLTMTPRIEGCEVRKTARELHRKLGVKNQFMQWWPLRQSRLVEGQDYGIITDERENSGPGRPGLDFWLTADAAKIICMLEHNEIGDAARRFFVNVEKQLRVREHQLLQTEKADRLSITARYDKLSERAQPALSFYAAVADSSQNFSMKEAAAVLSQKLM